MSTHKKYVTTVWFVTKIGAALGAGGFWGMLVGLLSKQVLNITGDDALFYVGLPVAVVFGILIWPKLPKILGFER